MSAPSTSAASIRRCAASCLSAAPWWRGDFETRHRFFSDNRKLLAEVEALEHKSRRRDILVDDEDLFRFYDARLPEDVISARHFDKWWKEAQKQDPSCSTSRKRC
jgi:HrpA-like RNA helicase